MRTVNTKYDRHALKGRFIVDVFGPLIDISRLAVFSGIENARTLTETELARELTRKSRTGEPFWDEKRIQTAVANALQNWSQNDGLINLTAILKLWHAEKNGTDVRMVSTTRNEDLFREAETAIREASEEVSPNSVAARFPFTLLEGAADLGPYLENLNKNEGDQRYTVVLHDSYSMDTTVEPELFDEWYPPATGRLEDLTPIIERGLEREMRMAPVGWLSEFNNNDTISLSDYKSFGEFLVFSDVRRLRLQQQVSRLSGLMEGAKSPLSVVLCGPSGSGKSFFVDQCYDEIIGKPENGEDRKITKTDLSSVTDMRDAIDDHINELLANTNNRVALLDEVDTEVAGERAYRYLMKPMTGSQVNSHGKSGVKFPGVLWFMAGSIADSKIEWVDRCKEKEMKVIDWSNRVSEWIEIPGVRSADAILQAIASLLKSGNKLRYATKESLLFFALPEWADARELRRIVQDIYDLHETKGKKSLLSSKTIERAIEYRPDLQKCLKEARKYELDGQVKLSA